MKKTVYKKLKNKIISGDLLPGTLLIEREISNEYGLSRTPIREVLWHLVSDGLLQKDFSGSYFVKKISLDEIFNLFQSREAIEGVAGKLACQKGDIEFFLNLKEIHEALEKVNIKKNPQDGIFYGQQLHDAIVLAANNPYLSEFYKKLRNISSLTRHITQRSIAIEEKSREAHLTIIDAIKERNEDKAEKQIRKHLQTTCRLMINDFYPSLLKA